ncbi:MAG: metallophosphoesterase [Eubacteriales bacterium]|nr:metallophosphoesterase [Eubacteriales bacterium]
MDNKNTKKKRMNPRTRRTIVNVLMLLILVLGFAGLVWADAAYNDSNFECDFYRVKTKTAEERVRLVFLTDVHLKQYGNDNAALINNVRKLSPDLIILGGDLVLSESAEYSGMLSMCTQLSNIAPVYGVLGNHENVRIYYHSDAALPDKFIEAGVKLLRNQYETIVVKDMKIDIVGIDSSSNNFELYGAKEFMDGYNAADTGSYKIVIAHEPKVFDILTAYGYDFDFGMAGHVHGGIIRVPMFGGLYSVEEGWLPKYDSGIYTLDNGASLLVSRGLGNSTRVPRLNNVPELSVVDLY